MPNFKVKFYEGGLWDKNEPRYIEAQDERDAAEILCGERSGVTNFRLRYSPSCSLMRPRPKHPTVPPARACVPLHETQPMVSRRGIEVQSPPCRRSWGRSIAARHHPLPQCPTASRAHEGMGSS